MTRKSKTPRTKVNVPSDLFGVYATLNRGMSDADFSFIFVKSALYEGCMEIHLNAARAVSKRCSPSSRAGNSKLH